MCALPLPHCCLYWFEYVPQSLSCPPVSRLDCYDGSVRLVTQRGAAATEKHNIDLV